MRPPRVQRSRLRYPLDVVLGSAAHVRLMRVLLHDVGGPVSVTDAARLAGLSPTGARKALEALAGVGMVERIGTGRAQTYGPTQANSLGHLLTQLFAQEQRAYEALLKSLREAIGIPEIRSAWAKDLSERDVRSLELDVVAEVKAVSWIGPELRARVASLEQQHDIIIEINVFTRADQPEMPADAVLVWGPGEESSRSGSPGARAGSDSAERSWRMAVVVANMVKSDPTLIRRALQHTDMLLREGQGTANSDLGEWRQLLETYSAERLRELLVSRSSRADRLRRSSPFFAVLTPEERDRLHKGIEGDR